MNRFLAAFVSILVLGTASLAEKKDDEIVLLVEQLGDESFEVREEAQKRLIKIGTSCRPLVQKALDSRDAEVRIRAERILAALKTAVGLEDLANDLKSPNKSTRLEAIRTIATRSLKTDDIKAGLRNLVRDKDQRIATEAAFALLLLGDEEIEHAQITKANCNGKYSKLLRRFDVASDRQDYGEFKDYGHYDACDYAGQSGLPTGYWVWVAPHWHIWKHCKDDVGNK